MAEWEREATKHSCGHQRHVCGDSRVVWYPFRTVCYPAMEEAAARREYERIHEDRPWHNGDFTRWSTERSSATPYHFQDGVDIGVSEVDVNPDDDFLTPPDPFGRDPFDSTGGGPDGRAS